MEEKGKLKTAIGEYWVVYVREGVAGYEAVCFPAELNPNIPKELQRRTFQISKKQYEDFKKLELEEDEDD
jgi:hypothetical protein